MMCKLLSGIFNSFIYGTTYLVHTSIKHQSLVIGPLVNGCRIILDWSDSINNNDLSGANKTNISTLVHHVEVGSCILNHMVDFGVCVLITLQVS